MGERLKVTIDTLSTGEKQQSFLLKLSDALRPLGSPVDIEEAATNTAMDFMDADRCHYSTIDEDNVIILRDAARGDLPSVAGVHPISSFPLYKAELNAGRPFVVEDVLTNNLLDKDLKELCLQSQYVSFINVPVIKNGKSVGLLSLVQTKPRKWTDAEVQLTVETAERTWAAVERAKAEEALLKSEEKYRSLFNSIHDAFCIIEMIFDENGKPVDWLYIETNPAFLKHATVEMNGKRISEIVPEIEMFWLEKYGDVAKTGQPVQLENIVKGLGDQWFQTSVFRHGPEGSNRVAVLFRNITERKQAEAKVKESESHFRTMADASPVLIWTIDANGLSSYYNKTFRDFIGVSKDEDISDWGKIVHPDDVEFTFNTINKAIRERKFYSLECRLLRADRHWRWVLAQGNPNFGADNEFLGFVGSSVDITERREAELKIKESEKKFEAAILAVEGVIWTNNARGEMVGEQPGWASLTGQRLEEYQGYRWSKAVHPDDAQPTIDAWNKAVENKSTFEFEHRLKTKHNGWRLFSVRAVPAFDENGIILQWVGVHTDITEQREAAKRIKESESYFRRLTDTVPAIIWITEPNGSCIYLNKHWYDYTGQSEEESKGFGWLEATHPDDKQHAAEIFIKANAEQKTFSATYRLRNTRGEYRWAVDIGSPKFSPDDEYEGMIGTVVDVHEEKLAQEKLTYRTALLEAHNQASVDGILLVDAKGKILSFNQRFIEIWNMPQGIVDAKDDEAALSFAMTQLVNPQQFIDKVKYLYEHPTETTLDELDFKDGKIVERNGYPVIGENGSYYAWSWTFRDITTQKKYEKTIIESEQRFRTLAETLPQLVWMTDEKGAYEFASNQWIDYSGLDPYAEDTWEKLVHPDDMKSIMQLWASSLQSGEPYRAEVRLINRQGVYRWHMVQGEPIKNEKGTIIKWIGAFTNIENLKEEQKQKNDFLSMASHELRTPVTTIKGYGQIIERLLEEKNDLQTLGFVKRMSKQVNKLNTLITDLLDITKMQQGGLIRYESVFNLDDLIKEVIDDLQKTNVTHQIVDNLNADIKIKGDKDKLGQVLNNLISNATKYSPGADKIIVSTQIVKDGVQLSVQDFGIGISTEGQQRVFEQFYRVTGENQSAFQGMGIGLYICAEIIKKEGGNIWVESAEGKGSVFYVWLPVDHSEGAIA